LILLIGAGWEMKYNAVLKIEAEKPASLIKAISPELSGPKTDRSNFTVKENKKKVVIEINAKDAVALRASADAIAKLLIVHEKMEKLSKTI
jgi:tRNA threonylcarbamoyladenosine modification (KEOPS) complex  Pcc1 subunit